MCMSRLGLIPAKLCSAYAHLLKPLHGTKVWTCKDDAGDFISMSMTERNGKFYFFIRTRDQDTNEVDDELLLENIVVEAPKHSSMRK